MCYTQSMTENMNEQKDTSMRRNSGYRLWKWLLGSIAALKKATVAIPEDAVAGPEGVVAGPEGAVNTSGAQASGKNAERSYEVVAVIPIELFTSHNLDTVRRSIQNNKMVCCEDLTGRNKIERYIQQFSAYDYKIYQVKNSGLHCQIMSKCNEVLDQEFKIKKDHIKKDHIEVLLAFPAKKSQTEDSAEMFENTSITISIIVSISDSDMLGDNEQKSKTLKMIGDKLKELVWENAEKNIKEILKNADNNEINKSISILGDKFAEEGKDSDDNHSSKNNNKTKIRRLDEMIEVNYVFTYFICYGYKYHIVVDKILNIDDNIKYSGDAWFLELSTVGLYKLQDNKEVFDQYISENYYNELCQKYREQKQNNYNQREKSDPSDLYEKVSDTYGWLVKELIPESQIRPRDIFYIPKINGREDYTSIILKYANRFCCFVKDSKDNSRKSDSDDGNRVIGMQIVLQSFWHRMTEFSRVLHQTSQIEKCELETNTKNRFMNQVHTTPTVAEQIVDVNSDDVDVGTLLDLAQATKIDSAAKIFNESKQTYLAIDAHEQTKERRQATEKANRGLQSMFLALALLTYALGLTELWGEWATISNSWKATITILFPVILAVFYFSFNYWERLRGFFKRDRRKKSVQ